jgi:hypothetical protein
MPQYLKIPMETTPGLYKIVKVEWIYENGVQCRELDSGCRSNIWFPNTLPATAEEHKKYYAGY